MGPPHEQFPKADSGEIDALLSAAYLPNDRMDLEQNILVVNTGEQLILFDSGSGIDPAFGVKTFGPGVGQPYLTSAWPASSRSRLTSWL